MNWYLDALRHSGINVVVLDCWNDPDPGYVWRTGTPTGAMWHHTASTSYSVSDYMREKANQWAGILRGDRLYQSGDGVPTIVLANQNPAPTSSGYGVRAVHDDYVVRDLRFLGRQTEPDDSDPQWAGNRSYWNTEVVLDGTGTSMRDDVWAMLVESAAILSEGKGWSAWRHIGHLQHTGRKIDLRDGRYPDGAATMEAFQDQVHLLLDDQEEPEMDLERWATRLRNPLDFDRMVVKGVITETERDYWVTVPTDSPEMADLRDAVAVRNPIWTE